MVPGQRTDHVDMQRGGAAKPGAGQSPQQAAKPPAVPPQTTVAQGQKVGA